MSKSFKKLPFVCGQQYSKIAHFYKRLHSKKVRKYSLLDENEDEILSGKKSCKKLTRLAYEISDFFYNPYRTSRKGVRPNKKDIEKLYRK